MGVKKLGIPKDLQDCANCVGDDGFPHQRAYHDEKTGLCMKGMMLGKQCPCIGFAIKAVH
jgi:hypothetical protein